MATIAYFGCSLDGYVADKDGGLEWLDMVPNSENDDLGWVDFMERVDVQLMGRATFETVLGFNCPWPYTKPVYILSNTMSKVPDGYEDKIELISGELVDVVQTLHAKGYKNIYVDGAKTIQGFLKEDLLDELIFTTLPVLLGGGVPLFASLENKLEFELVKSEVLLNAMVKSYYRRIR